MGKIPSKGTFVTKKSGSYQGHSNELGHGGRSRQLRTELHKKSPGMPESEVEAIIGKNARLKGAAPGQAHYHGKRKK